MIRAKGTHTYDIFLEYLLCPKCGAIIESRANYQYRFGKYEKEVECDRCHHQFTQHKDLKPMFGPFFE